MSCPHLYRHRPCATANECRSRSMKNYWTIVKAIAEDEKVSLSIAQEILRRKRNLFRSGEADLYWTRFLAGFFPQDWITWIRQPVSTGWDDAA